jgi:hypothetical protein
LYSTQPATNTHHPDKRALQTTGRDRPRLVNPLQAETHSAETTLNCSYRAVSAEWVSACKRGQPRAAAAGEVSQRPHRDPHRRPHGEVGQRPAGKGHQ